jgi:aryl-alcohol dehydrogenase-like predicted oxidoreductase
VEHRPLGESGVEVSVLSLGSWRTFERVPRETGLAVLTAARDAGIDFLDDARYDDETGAAPLPTGYSEVVFGELFRAAGWDRGEVVIANKLWWEFWPRETAAEELDGSLERMGLDYLDLVYSERPPDGVPVAEVVSAVSELIASGKVRAWGLLNWRHELAAAAIRFASVEGLPAPCAAQLPYSLAYPEFVEDQAMSAALDAAGAHVVASAVLANGALTGKYAAGDGTGRLSAMLDDPRRRKALEIGRHLRTMAEQLTTTPARLAIAFALGNQRVASVLFGATSPSQVADNVGALELFHRLTGAEVAELRLLTELD